MEIDPKKYETTTFCWSCGSTGPCNCGADRVAITRTLPNFILPFCSGSQDENIWNPDGSARIHTCLTAGDANKLKFGDISEIKIEDGKFRV